MSNSKIQDISRYKKLPEDVQTFELMRRLLPQFQPLLKSFGVNIVEREAVLLDAAPMLSEVQDLVTQPR